MSSQAGNVQSEPLNPRVWLQRAPSSDVAFANMVFETTQQLSGLRQRGYEELGALKSPVVNSGGALRWECTAVRNVVAESGSLLVEAGGNVVAVVSDTRVRWAFEWGRDVRCSWWIDSCLVGVLVGGEDASGLALFVVDLEGKVRQTGLGTGLVQAVIAQRQTVVCAVPGEQRDTLVLRLWHIEHKDQVVAVDGGCLGGDCPLVVGLRWVAPGIGLAATQTGGVWFSTLPPRTLPCDMCHVPTTLSWRWQESVVAVDFSSVWPPENPVLCLPGPTAMAFYRMDAVGAKLHQHAFPSGWVWLCASAQAFALLSPCRRQVTVCRMPKGERLYTLQTQDPILDAWMMGSLCAVSTGKALYIVKDSLFGAKS
ncbi:hypothetical protein GGF46_004619 [Coemansia sp. RSA 552]|nr:hypothetical protein GGF46_004619 [Coemansia sp. RSA 552]